MGQREYFHFHGHGGEYFRIWIVNLLLTILTIGIYSPWAKVRKNRYIYGCLELSGSHFDYIAKPATILRGRLVALLVLALVIAAQSLSMPLYIASLTIIVLLTPWLVVRARMFNMRNTLFRNIRFEFRPAYAAAYKAIFLYGFLSIITLGLAVPYAHYRRSSFVIGNTRYGNLGFTIGDVAGKFYSAYFVGTCLGLLMVIPAADLLAQFIGPNGGELAGPENPLQKMTVMPFLIAIFLYYVVGKLVAALIFRIISNNTSLGAADSGSPRHQLGCDWLMPAMLWIYVSNLIAIILSLGLLIPWAQIRILKYQLDHTWLAISGELDSVIAGQSQNVTSIGEEIGDVFDVDIGL